MLSIEAAIVASMDSGKLILPEYIEAVVIAGDAISILTPDAITTMSVQTFHNYILDWLDAIIEV